MLRQSRRQTLQPPITKVSRQVRSEALPLYYKVNRFASAIESGFENDSSEVLVQWLEATGQDNLDLIKNLLIVHKWPSGTEVSNWDRITSRAGVSLPQDVVELTKPVSIECRTIDID